MICEANHSGGICRDTVGHEEVEQTPQLHQVVLQWCTRQEQAMLRFEAEESLPSLTAEIFDVVRLVENHVAPVLAPEDVLVGEHDLIAGNAHLPMVFCVPAHALLLTLLLVAVVGQNLHAGQKLFELHLPVQNDRGGDDDEVRTPNTFVARKMTKKSDSLDRFSAVSYVRAPGSSPKTHLVGQDTVHVVAIK